MKKIFLLIGCLVATAAVRGDIIPSFVGATPSGGNTVWGYQINITTDQQVTTGDFFTIYDFGAFIAGSNAQPSGWTFSSSLLGPTPSATNPPDDPTLQNITWTYSGPTLASNTSAGPFSVSTVGTQPSPVPLRDSYFAAQATRSTGANIGTKINNVGRIPVPTTVPEPTTLSLIALGAAGAAIRALRRRRQ